MPPYDMWSRYRINERIKEGYEKRMERVKLMEEWEEVKGRMRICIKKRMELLNIK